MNRFDDYYDIRHARLDDTESIMVFIRDEWPKKNHILSTNKDFFLYEFQNGDLLNFVIAVNRNTRCIDGMVGFYPASDIKETLDIWASMWLTRRKGSIPFLGLEIFNRMKQITGYRFLGGLGTNPETSLPLLKNKASHFGFKLKHYYMLSKQDDYKIAVIATIPDLARPEGMSRNTLNLVKSMTDISDRAMCATRYSVPLKNEWYINKRFFCHPIYEYIVWEIKADSGNGILVGREVELNGAKILRIVDFIGEQGLLDGLYDEFSALKQGYEYIDFLVHGIDEAHLTNAGFTLKTEQDGNVIPHYFEPFVQSNIEIYGTSEYPDVRMCKADADMDRPNNY